MKKFSTSDRLKQIMLERNLKQTDILEACKPYCKMYGIKLAKSDLSQYISGKVQPKQDKLSILGMALDVNEVWLMGYDYVPMERGTEHEDSIKTKHSEEYSNISAIYTDGIYKIPVFETVSAGFGTYASSDIIDYIPIFVKNPNEVPDLMGIKVSGDSMYPKIEDGDIIVVRKQTSVDSGSIAVLLLDGDEGLVKKVEYGKGWIDLISINPEYKTRHFEGADVLRLQVVGLVKQIIKML